VDMVEEGSASTTEEANENTSLLPPSGISTHEHRDVRSHKYTEEPPTSRPRVHWEDSGGRGPLVTSSQRVTERRDNRTSGVAGKVKVCLVESIRFHVVPVDSLSNDGM
jgi:hypothetical protein